MNNKLFLLQRLGQVLVKIATFIAVIVGAKWLLYKLTDPFVVPWLNSHSASSYMFANYMSGEATLAAAIFTAYGMMRWRQPKRATAIKKQALPFMVLRSVVGFAFAFVVGAVLVFAVYVLLAKMGRYSVTGVNDQFSAGYEISYLLLLSIAEEVFARKYIQNIVEEKLGSGVALVLTTTVFSLVHLHNQGAATSLHVAVQTLYRVGTISFFLSTTYLLTRRIWIPIALHWSIDFFLFIFVGDSDTTTGALNAIFDATLANIDSVQSAVFAVAGAITIALAVRKGQWCALPKPD